MEVLNVKIEKEIIKDIDKTLKKHRYSTRSEFVRDAIRQKLTALEKEELIKNVAKLKGFSKRKTTDEDLHKAREKAFAFLEKSLS